METNDTAPIEAQVVRPDWSRDVINLRKKENGLLKINDIFGPPIDVRNEVFRAFLDMCAEHSIPDENFYDWIDRWIDSQMRSKGYTRLRNNIAFSRNSEKEWAKEYKIVAVR